MSRKIVLLYKRLPPRLRERLEAKFDVKDFSGVAAPADDPAFRAALQSAHGMLGVGVALDRELLAEAKNLEVISSISAGVDHYDIEYLNRRNILLCHTPDVLTETTADTAFLLILATARRAVELAEMVRRGEWTASLGEQYFGVDVHGKRLGIVGMGRIGTAIGRRGRFGFNMEIIYHNRSRNARAEAELGATWRPLEALLRESDFICASAPLSEATRGLFGAEQFQQMGPDAIFVNISRGGVVDEPALIEALRHGVIRAAGLDVFATEPLPGDSPLAQMDNVVALPHIGSATRETRAAMAERAVENLVVALEGNKPATPYNWDRRGATSIKQP
jgi:phosphogluconate 2-dehydrogenase